MTENKERGGIFFERLDRLGHDKKYPAWRYHAVYEPVVVNNEKEDIEAREQGWQQMKAPVTAHQAFHNFYHDLEDMNCRQLVKYAKDEFGADLPAEAGKSKILWALWRMATGSPKTKERVVLLAQSIRMNLDETHAQIRRMAGNLEDCQEVEEKEIWL